MIKILHLTAHLGGGVGKAISGICKCDGEFSHTVVCIDPPLKSDALRTLEESGVNVVISPSNARLIELVRGSDILQVEWWNHPALLERLVNLSNVDMRLLVWSHVSGLFNPIIPAKLIQSSNSFVFSSACSLLMTKNNDKYPIDKLSVISSGDGGSVMSLEKSYDEIKAAYIGTLNFSKLHPRVINYFNSVCDDRFSVSMFGDAENAEDLIREAEKIKRPQLIKIEGYAFNVMDVFKEINLMPYILNPTHFGTAENALLEAMSMGVVPIVLDNPAEMCIVKNMETGIVIRNENEFSEAVRWLGQNPSEFKKMGDRARHYVRNQFCHARSSSLFEKTYLNLLSHPRQKIQFEEILGHEPYELFLSCQADKTIFGLDGKVYLEENNPFFYSIIDHNKGSPFQFSRHFPNDAILKQWCVNIKNEFL